MKPKVRRVDGVRVLSIQQPWAWAIVEGHKPVENRTWTTRYRGPVLIHAGVTVRGPEIEYLRDEFRLKPPSRFEIDRGCIVGVAELVDVVTRKNAKRYGRWFLGPYGLVLRNAVALRKPVKVKSQLGLYRPTAALLARVNRQLPARRRIRAGER
jgi:ASCH domain